MKPKPVITLLGLVGCAAIVIVWWLSPAQPSGEIGSRILELRRLVAAETAKATKLVPEYAPKTLGRIDDHSVSATDILHQLPGVVEVEAPLTGTKPTHRLIHLRDWHFVPKDLYALDMKAAYTRPLSDHEIDLLHEEHLLEVELVQLEQMALLRCLIKHHGLKRVFSEGFSEGELAGYKDKIAAHRAVENEQIPALRKQLAEVRTMMTDMKHGDERYAKAKNIEDEIVGLLNQHRVALLEIGAAGRLLMSGELEEVLPIEDAEKLDQAKPVTPAGDIRVDQSKVNSRHDAQVQMAFKRGSVALVILGGAHDLSANAARLTDDGCEYLRVTTKWYREFSQR